ncbi:hypothetical protein CBR_g19727 [Chara braunii]|uniref:Uncharacterized protein n=1 Tax=Chara braunii TaxID=69332 RepID=A0A388JTQ3_CHABU|nr:hypothetical protein CBR_g19727 [Chara braunii]|eukprot:GBG61194.1 hypothetical protein CBR_g19727 [Chara braunii]
MVNLVCMKPVMQVLEYEPVVNLVCMKLVMQVLEHKPVVNVVCMKPAMQVLDYNCEAREKLLTCGDAYKFGPGMDHLQVADGIICSLPSAGIDLAQVDWCLTRSH